MGYNKMSTLQYLDKLYSIQPQILLVSRLDNKSHWGDSCLYLGDKYNSYKEYNHRSMLDTEIVFEYDLDNKEVNRKYIDLIATKLSKDKIEWAKFDSGNKSVHLHCFIAVKNARSIPGLKRQFVKYYTSDLPKPDMLLISTMNHLIRCEYGLNEKTGKKKVLISKTSKYPMVCDIPSDIWVKYQKYSEWLSKYNMTMKVSSLKDSDAIKFILDTKNFEKIKDGRKRGLFSLIWSLQGSMSKEELISLLTSWYKYANGNTFSENDIIKYINYYEGKNYSERFKRDYINDLLSDLGQESLMIK